MGRFWKLEVWQHSRQLTKAVYRTTREFPSEERFGLVAQMRSAAVSIMSNIAEGCGRNRDGEMLRSLYIAQGSANELENQCIVAGDQGFLSQNDARDLRRAVGRVRKMLAGLMHHVRTRSTDSR